MGLDCLNWLRGSLHNNTCVKKIDTGNSIPNENDLHMQLSILVVINFAKKENNCDERKERNRNLKRIKITSL